MRVVQKKLTDELYDYLFAPGSTPGVLYGLHKTRKQDCLIRLILIALNIFKYNVAKFFVPIIASLTTYDYTFINSTQFVTEGSKIKLPNNAYLASFY